VERLGKTRLFVKYCKDFRNLNLELGVARSNWEFSIVDFGFNKQRRTFVLLANVANLDTRRDNRMFDTADLCFEILE